jgi:hypothetical protein
MKQSVKQNRILIFQFLPKEGIIITQDCILMCMYSI